MRYGDSQTIDVLVRFSNHQIIPIAFRTGKHHYPIERIEEVIPADETSEPITHFRVSNGDGVYVLTFSPLRLEWKLEGMGVT